MRQPPRPVNDRDVDSSNATLSTLLGGTQRSWMTGGLGTTPVRPTPRRVSITTTEAPSRSGHARRAPDQANAVLSVVNNNALQSPAFTLAVQTPASPISEVPARESPVTSPLASPSGAQQTRSPHDSHSSPVNKTISFGAILGGNHRQEAAVVEHAEGSGIIDGIDVALASRVASSPVGQASHIRASVTVIDLLQTPSPEMPSAVPITAAVPGHAPQQINRLTVEQQREMINAGARQSAPMTGQSSDPTIRRTSGNQMHPSENSSRGIPSPTIPQKRQRNSVPVMPSLKPRATLVNAYLTTLLRQGRPPSNFETTRINLLRDACEKDDAFYVAVHQLFCAWDVNETILTTLNQVHHSVNVPDQAVLRVGFEQLSCLLRVNKELAKHVLNWFAVFPSPLSDLVRTSEPYRRTVQGALHFISRLGDEWLQLSTDCRERNYPPLVEEFNNRLGVSSKTLQRILFTAARRNLEVEDKDAKVAEKLDRLFLKDQHEYDALVARVNTDRPPLPKELQERRGRLAAEYSFILIEFYNQRDATTLPSINQATNAQDRIPTPASDMHVYRSVAAQPAVPTRTAAPPELNTAAQSMTLNSPNLNNAGFPRQSPHMQGQRASPHIATPPQQLQSPTTVQPQSGPWNGQGYYMNGQFIQLSAGQNTNNSAYAAQLGPSQEIDAQIRNVEAQLGGLYSQYQGLRIPSHIASQEQYLLQQRQLMYQQRSRILGQAPQQQNGFPPRPHGQVQAQNSYRTQPNGSGRPSPTVTTQRAPGFPPSGRSNLSPQNNNVRRVSASTTPTLQSNGFPSPGQQQYAVPPTNPPSRAQNATFRVTPQLHNPRQAQQAHQAQQAQMQQQYQQQPQRQPRMQGNGAPQGPIIMEYEDAYKSMGLPERDWPLIPPIGIFHRGAPPNPDRTALHQAHLRSPTLVNVTPSFEKEILRYYQVVKSLAAGPIMLVTKKPVREVTFFITQQDHDRIAKRLVVQCAGQIPDRSYTTGTLQYRMRCAAFGKGTTECTDSEFVVADPSWPNSTIFSIKGHPDASAQQIELRRKASHGKDSPVDLTSYIQDFEPNVNITVTVSIPGRPKCFSEKSYFFAVEVVEVFDHAQLMHSCQLQRRDAAVTLQKLKQSLGGNDDDEIAMVSDKVTLDLTDPFSSQLFTVPVKGTTCLHRECFDLETFLLSRISKPAAQSTSSTTLPWDEKGKVKQPSMIDVWRCPICNRDARPQSLVVDEFLVGIREGLVAKGLEGRVKAVLIDKDGNWEPRVDEDGGQAEESDSGSDGDGMYDRRRKERRKSARARGVNGGAGGGERTVIDLSD